MSLIFDIETGPLPIDQVLQFSTPFVPPAHPGEFDPASVRYGNLKDEAKRAEKLAAAQAEHAAAVANYEQSLADAEAAHVANLMDRAALSPVTGRVLAIGMQSSSGYSVMDGTDESDCIRRFWSQYTKCRAANRRMIGQNIFGFDLPFLIRRSWILGVDVPVTVRDGRYFDRLFVDVRDVWLCGQRWSDCESNLDHIARALGVGTKNGHGAEFAKLWFGTPEEREQAVAYLVNDLELTARVAERLGVV